MVLLGFRQVVVKYRDKCPERGKCCNDIGARERGAPNKTWEMRKAEGDLEDEAELARRRLVLVGPGGE